MKRCDDALVLLLIVENEIRNKLFFFLSFVLMKFLQLDKCILINSFGIRMTNSIEIAFGGSASLEFIMTIMFSDRFRMKQWAHVVCSFFSSFDDATASFGLILLETIDDDKLSFFYFVRNLCFH